MTRSLLALFMRGYLHFLRTQMGQAARDLVPFDNAYNQYLRLEQDAGE